MVGHPSHTRRPRGSVHPRRLCEPGGALLALGLLNPAGALLIAGAMVMAIAKVHWPNGLWITNDGFEYPLLLLVILLVLGYFGPGRYALDSELGIALPIQPVFWAGLVGVLVVTVVGVLSCCLRHSVPLALVF
jgi:hypothetical protein